MTSLDSAAAQLNSRGNPGVDVSNVGQKSPGQELGDRLADVRKLLTVSTDMLERVLSSVHGREPAQPERAPLVPPKKEEFRRFFPAARRLVDDIEAEAKRIAALAEGFDQAF